MLCVLFASVRDTRADSAVKFNPVAGLNATLHALNHGWNNSSENMPVFHAHVVGL